LAPRSLFHSVVSLRLRCRGSPEARSNVMDAQADEQMSRKRLPIAYTARESRLSSGRLLLALSSISVETE
jgi:hypothetical protein